MSADDGIYILESKDGFRVIYAAAIENVWEWDSTYTSKHLIPKYLKEYFGEAKVLNSRDAAWEEALKQIKELPYLQYGIRIIPGWEDKLFPGIVVMF